jgi:hypothetical protein
VMCPGRSSSHIADLLSQLQVANVMNGLPYQAILGLTGPFAHSASLLNVGFAVYQKGPFLRHRYAGYWF